MKKFILLIIIILNLNPTVFSCDRHGKSGFAPKNNMKISQWDKDTNGMTKQKFLEIINEVYNIYSPIVKERGGDLTMKNFWEDDTVNASAERAAGDVWIVNMYGGLARHPKTTNDGFSMIVCHELGHHIGGAPLYRDDEWASNEGQADYFAAMKCMRRVFLNQENRKIVSRMIVDPEATKQCQSVYTDDNEIAICERIAMAGKSLGSVLASITGGSSVKFNTPDKTVVRSTFDGHPEAQCRLDTYFQGILCNKSFDQDVDIIDPIIGTCNLKEGYKLGIRPRCWYKPLSSEI